MEKIKNIFVGAVGFAVSACVCIFVGMATFGAWLTHIIYCADVGAIGWLVAGVLVFPIGVIHGWVIWIRILF